MTRCTDCVDLHVACPQQEIQPMLGFVFYQHGLQVQWHSPVEGIAYQGTRGKCFIFGSIAQYHEIFFQLFPMPDKSYIVRLIKSFRGYHRHMEHIFIEKKFVEVVNMLSYYFTSMGWFQNIVYY